MTPAELRDAERLVDLLVPKLERRRTRRYELHPHGRRIAPRAMFRRNLGTGGEISRGSGAGRSAAPPAGRDLRHLGLDGAPRAAAPAVHPGARGAVDVHTESFVFGTRLTRVTRLLRDRDRDRALARVADSVTDWAGGTRIGESFHEFNKNWARRSLRSSGVVIVVSDGWDRGDPALVASETARLRRNCHRLVWLNPLAGTPGYQPLAAGMRAAFPTSTTSCRPGPLPASSGSARSSPASGPPTSGGGARRRRTRHSPGIGPTVAGTLRRRR